MSRYVQVKPHRHREEEHFEQPFPFPSPKVKTFVDELEEIEELLEEVED